MDVLVTGGAGFIGSNLVRCLLAAGADVVYSTTCPPDPRTTSITCRTGWSARWGDVLNLPMVRRAVDGVDVVYDSRRFRPWLAR